MVLLREERCCERIWLNQGFASRYSNCSRRGVVVSGRKLYCKQHDPKAVEARTNQRGERWSAEQQMIIRERAALSACEGISTDSLTPGLVRRLLTIIAELDLSGNGELTPETVEFVDSIKVEE